MAFFHEGPRQPFLRVPAAVAWLILILIGVQALRVWAFAPETDPIIANYALIPARYSHAFLASHAANPGSVLERLLPFVTYIFLHGSFTHVLINSAWLLVFGSVVAQRFGTVWFLVFFLLCGIAGGLVHLATNWASTAPMVGASAAISGLMGAAFRMLPMSPADRGPALVPIFSPQILLWSAVWAVVNIVAGVTGFGGGGDMQLIAWQAHLGGYAAGLFLAGPFQALATRRAASRPA
ncbi:MAG TPA: rhomboid family intramembrane serine protease [Rhizomicrobium sp.]|jgi:membrane associated rhomboid family serine protease